METQATTGGNTGIIPSVQNFEIEQLRDITLILGDNLDYMRTLPDGAFDLGIVDPPYGILSKAGGRLNKYGDGHKTWDQAVPTDEYFQELFRVTKNQIIWGGNYFPILWENGCKGFIFWYKHQPVTNWAAGEMAWTSFNRPAMCFDYMCYGGINQDDFRFHPTQKPIDLYRWLLQNYANPGQTILDTHGGSMTSARAAHDMGFRMTIIEIDPTYYAKAKKQLQDYMMTQKLF